MMETYYIFRYPSASGMGSDYDTRLVSDTDFRRIVRYELENNTDRPDERLTGRWDDEVFCDSKDMEEVVQDVIQKCMNRCSTYAGKNDLILLSDSIPHRFEKVRMEDTIFHMWNKWGFYGDLVVGEIIFYRHFIDLTGMDDVAGLDGGEIHEFCPYHAKNVLENTYFCNDWEAARNMYEEASRRHKEMIDEDLAEGRTANQEIVRIYQRQMAALRKMENPVNGPDEYLSHMYRDNYTKWNRERFEDDLRELGKKDYRNMLYRNGVGFMKEPGAFYTKKEEETDEYRYDEIFKNGTEIEYVTGDLIWREEGMSNDLCACQALQSVYGYD